MNDATVDDIPSFRQALIRQKTKRGLYSPAPGKVEHLPISLFVLSVFSIKCCNGIYMVESVPPARQAGYKC